MRKIFEWIYLITVVQHLVNCFCVPPLIPVKKFTIIIIIIIITIIQYLLNT